MHKQPLTVRVGPEGELERAVEGVAADGTPRVLVRDGERLAVVISPDEYAELRLDDAWPAYEAERVREALRAGTGALAGIDREQFTRDLRDQRGQDSPGRPD